MYVSHFEEEDYTVQNILHKSQITKGRSDKFEYNFFEVLVIRKVRMCFIISNNITLKIKTFV